MNYYTGANTAGGYVDLTNDNVFDIKTKVRLECDNIFVRNLIVGSLTDNCEKIMTVGSATLADSVIFRDKSIAVLSGITNADKTFKIDCSCDYTFDNGLLSALYEKMFDELKKAKTVHDEWESIYIGNMNFKMLDSFCDEIICKLVKKNSLTGSSKTYKRFFATSAVGGVKNYIDSLTSDLEKRYFVKGRPGTGKSSFLKRLAVELKTNGYDVEEYYCSLDPKSFDMVVSRELSFCVFDSTEPHEKNPERQTDEILDFYLNSGLGGIDEKYDKDLKEVSLRYKKHIYEAMLQFEKAWQIKEDCDRKNFIKTDAKKLGGQIRDFFEEFNLTRC